MSGTVANRDVLFRFVGANDERSGSELTRADSGNFVDRIRDGGVREKTADLASKLEGTPAESIKPRFNCGSSSGVSSQNRFQTCVCARDGAEKRS